MILSPHPALFCVSGPRTRTQGRGEAEWGKNEEWERRKPFLMGKRFDVVPMCKIKSHL